MSAGPSLPTLLLDISTWDIVLDASGNLAIAQPPYSTAQDVASACRTFLGECYYDTTIGIPYLAEILGHSPPLNVLSGFMVQAALSVPGVATAQFAVYSVVGRRVTGAITFTTNEGYEGVVTVSGQQPIGSPYWTADSTVITADSTVTVA